MSEDIYDEVMFNEINENDPAHALPQCEERLKDALDVMIEDSEGQFDFSYSSKQSLDGCQQIKELFKSVYLRFDCPNCPRPQKSDRQKRWTSVAGLIRIKFGFKKVRDEKKNETIRLLVFKLKIYGMKCQKCRKYGQAQIYDSQMQNIEQYFCQLVSNILNLVPPPSRQRRNQRPRKVPSLKTHRSDLCQACALGIHKMKKNQRNRSQSRGRNHNTYRNRITIRRK